MRRPLSMPMESRTQYYWECPQTAFRRSSPHRSSMGAMKLARYTSPSLTRDLIIRSVKASLLQNTAVLARVTGKAYGFFGGIPGQLLRFSPTKAFGRRLQTSSPAYYVFMPIGRFSVGNTEICKSDIRYAEPPEIGGEAFLLLGGQRGNS